MAHAKKVNPEVQAYYDGLDEDGKTDLDRRMVEAGRTLADLRWAASTGKLDQRFLMPIKVPNSQPAGGLNRARYTDAELDACDPDPEVGGDSLPHSGGGFAGKRRKGEKLPEGKDLAGYIKDELGDGRALADFYIDIVTMSAKHARKSGVFMNHKLAAAQWLGDRGWGKAKGEDGDSKGITINLIDHSGAPVPAGPKVVMVEQNEMKQALIVDHDAGKDRPSDGEPLTVTLDDLYERTATAIARRSDDKVIEEIAEKELVVENDFSLRE